ncbi:unnamed protein product, partial [Amoebophrya sp. A25]|eukprot:GSA25T00019309001.1
MGSPEDGQGGRISVKSSSPPPPPSPPPRSSAISKRPLISGCTCVIADNNIRSGFHIFLRRCDGNRSHVALLEIVAVNPAEGWSPTI